MRPSGSTFTLLLTSLIFTSTLSGPFSGLQGVSAKALVYNTPICAQGVEYCSAAIASLHPENSRGPGVGSGYKHPTKTKNATPFKKKKIRLTNAQRLAMGMKLNPPKRRGSAVQPRQAEPSGEPENRMMPTSQYSTGVASLKTNGPSTEGYIGAVTVDGAVYKMEKGLVDAALLVVSSIPNSEDTFLINVEGGDISQNYPFLGLVQGRDNTDTTLGPGSFHYVYVTGVAGPAGNLGDGPAFVDNAYSAVTSLTRVAETAVWKLDSKTNTMSPIWVNPDGSVVELTLFLQDGLLYATGDLAAFSTQYTASVTPVAIEMIY